MESKPRGILVLKCCIEHAPSLPNEPLRISSHPIYIYPPQQIAMDYLEMEQHSYLSIVDKFSAWLSIYHFPASATARRQISICCELFKMYGVFEEI